MLKEGATVVGWGRTKPNLVNDQFKFVKTDVRDFKSVENAYHQTISEVGEDISILINNAGLGFEGYLDEMDMDRWHQMFETNVDGIFYCSKLLIPNMKEHDLGHIINISSIAGTTGIPGMSAYCATKHAVRGLSHSMYKELRNYGIKVTCIYPGSVKTNFFDEIDSVEANDNMMQPEDIASSIIHCLKSSDNYHHVDIEVRPLRPKGKK
ncbi:SDR family oxidoreductase [Fulvivirga sp. RKSG066]|nr:SDR family oxidoreductase [Fulvivirga aurantia]